MRALRGGGSLGRDLKTVNTGLTEFAPEREVMQKTSDPATTHTVWLPLLR